MDHLQQKMDESYTDRASVNSVLATDALERKREVICRPLATRNGKLFVKSAFAINLMVSMQMLWQHACAPQWARLVPSPLLPLQLSASIAETVVAATKPGNPSAACASPPISPAPGAMSRRRSIHFQCRAEAEMAHGCLSRELGLCLRPSFRRRHDGETRRGEERGGEGSQPTLRSAMQQR